MKTTLCTFIFTLVSMAFPVRGDTWQERTVAAVLVQEAGGDGRVGMEAVAEVMLNRHLRSGHRIIDIVLEPGNFACLNKKDKDILYLQALRHPRFEEAMEISRTLFHRPEALPRRVRGADHYDRANAHPYWAKGIPPVSVLGHHAFWKLAL